MNWDRLKKRLMGVALVLVLLLGSGMILESTTEARTQGRRWYERERREEVQKGYRDGLDRGEEDARDRKSYNPNNSEHYRHGSNPYREGFRRGYAEGYRRYARRR
jgi:hypothetical protein